MTTTAQIEAALKAAKAFFNVTPSEPRTTVDQILLRELGEALSKLFHYDDDTTMQTIHDALCSGDLIATTVQGHIIPRGSWPNDVSYWASNWYWGEIFFDSVEGFDGQLPVIPKADCVAWIKQHAEVSKSGPGRPTKGAEGNAAAKAYWQEHPNGHQHTPNNTWPKAAVAVSRIIGEPISASTLRRRLGLKK